MDEKQYIASSACMKCSFGTNTATLNVLPTWRAFLASKPMANISDHLSLVNIPSFGRCSSLMYPPTASATAAAQGTLTPMPCIPRTTSKWMLGHDKTIIGNDAALLISSKCRCQFGGIITLTNDGQNGCGADSVIKSDPIEITTKEKQITNTTNISWNSDDTVASFSQMTKNEEDNWKKKYAREIEKFNSDLTLITNMYGALDMLEKGTAVNPNSKIFGADDNLYDETSIYHGSTTDKEGNTIYLGRISNSNYSISNKGSEDEPHLLTKIYSDLISNIRPIKNTKVVLCIDFDAKIGGIILNIGFGWDNRLRRFLEVEYANWVGVSLELDFNEKEGKGIQRIFNMIKRAGKKINPVKISLKFEENIAPPLYDWPETSLFADINFDIFQVFEIKGLYERDTMNSSNKYEIEGVFHFPKLDIIVKWNSNQLDNGMAGFTIAVSGEMLHEDERPIGLAMLRKMKEKTRPSFGIQARFGPRFKYTWQLENLIEKSAYDYSNRSR